MVKPCDQSFKQNNFELNRTKCESHNEHLEFFSNIFGARDMPIDLRDVAMIKMPHNEQNISELCNQLCRAGDCSLFMFDFVKSAKINEQEEHQGDIG